MRLIDADQITDHEIIDYLGIKYASCLPDVRDMLNDQPTIEAVPVLEAERRVFVVPRFCGTDKFCEPIWKNGVVYQCSFCGRRTVIKEHFCPHCGAKMKGGAE